MGGEAEGEFIAGCEDSGDRDDLIKCKPKMRLPDGTEVPLSSGDVEIIKRGPNEYLYKKDGGTTSKTRELLKRDLMTHHLK